MTFRRMRGLLTTAILWSLALSLTVIVFTSAFALAGAHSGSGRQLVRDLADLLPMALVLGGIAGALFASLVLLAERHETLRSVSEQRFRVWGFVAGALPMAVFEGVARFGQPHLSLASAFLPIVCFGVGGAHVAPAMLRTARRANVASSSDQSSSCPPTI